MDKTPEEIRKSERAGYMRGYYANHRTKILQQQKRAHDRLRQILARKPVTNRFRMCLICHKPIDPTWRNDAQCHRHERA